MVVAAPMRKESPEKRRSGVLLQHLNDLLLSSVAGHKYFVQQKSHYCAAGTAACAEVPGMSYVVHDICNTVCGYRNIDQGMPR